MLSCKKMLKKHNENKLKDFDNLWKYIEERVENTEKDIANGVGIIISYEHQEQIVLKAVKKLKSLGYKAVLKRDSWGYDLIVSWRF